MVSSPVGNLVITTATTTTMPEDQQQDNASLFSANSEEESFSIRKHLHWWNTLAFVFNFVVTYGVGTMGWIGKGTNEELSEKYQSLVTPNSAAFSIWAVIFLSQGVFTVVQWLPTFRNKALIQQGVGYYYIGTCIFQAVWTIAFAYEIIWLSLICMVAIWFTLLAIVYSQYSLMHTATLVDFWLFCFPFAVHCGWITAASALNANVLVIDQGGEAVVQLAAAIVSLAVLGATSVWVLFGLNQPNYTLATVVAWAFWWIFVELKSPKPLIIQTFSLESIQGVSYAAVSLATIVLTQIGVRVFVASMKRLKDHDEEATVSFAPTSVDSFRFGQQQQDGQVRNESACDAA